VLCAASICASASAAGNTSNAAHAPTHVTDTARLIRCNEAFMVVLI
jgi:hypothetical protein